MGLIATGVIGGCTTGTSVPSVGGYWMVKVQDNHANIYKYPQGNTPSPTTSSVYLGPTSADAQRYSAQAAKTLGVSPSDITNLN
jgi:hypothetical protein